MTGSLIGLIWTILFNSLYIVLIRNQIYLLFFGICRFMRMRQFKHLAKFQIVWDYFMHEWLRITLHYNWGSMVKIMSWQKKNNYQMFVLFLFLRLFGAYFVNCFPRYLIREKISFMFYSPLNKTNEGRPRAGAGWKKRNIIFFCFSLSGKMKSTNLFIKFQIKVFFWKSLCSD